MDLSKIISEEFRILVTNLPEKQKITCLIHYDLPSSVLGSNRTSIFKKYMKKNTEYFRREQISFQKITPTVIKADLNQTQIYELSKYTFVIAIMDEINT